jgi:hypothetical protein
LTNNYNAWLYEEKKAHGDKLLTEYDHGLDIGKNSIVDFILKNKEFNLERDAEELVLHDTNNRAYKKAKKARKDWLTRLMQICPKRQGRLRAWREAVDENEHAETTNKKEQATKRRRLMKDLRK